MMLNLLNGFPYIQISKLTTFRSLILNIFFNNCQIMQALKRLKGTSTDKHGKMAEGTKRIFDELTEAAMKLMENGDYSMLFFLV